MGARLASAMADYERAVKEKLTEVAGLQAQLSLARREGSGVEMGKEVERLKGEVRNMGRQLEEEREGRRRAELKAEQLKVDLGGMEVLVNNGNTGNDDSMVQLGLSGAAEVAGNSSSLRIREELHRSLVTRDFSLLRHLYMSQLFRWEIARKGRKFPSWRLPVPAWRSSLGRKNLRCFVCI